MHAIVSTAKRSFPAVLALTLTLAVTRSALAEAPLRSLGGTTWRSPLTLDDGQQGAIGITFDRDGDFLLAVADAQDRVLQKIHGSYTVSEGTLTLYNENGKVLCREKILRHNRTSLVTKSTKGETVWSRMD